MCEFVLGANRRDAQRVAVAFVGQGLQSRSISYQTDRARVLWATVVLMVVRCAARGERRGRLRHSDLARGAKVVGRRLPDCPS